VTGPPDEEVGARAKLTPKNADHLHGTTEPDNNTQFSPSWRRRGDNRADAAWLTVSRLIIRPRLRSRLRYRGYERAALWLDRLCGEDTP
jgi:hypothetical protein